METSKLSERAILFTVSIHGWTGQRKNRKASDEYATQINAAKDAVDLLTKIVPKRELDPIRQAGQRAYRFFVQQTLPWSDGGWRILPSDKFFAFRTKLMEMIADHDDKVADLAKRWPGITSESALRQRLGKLYDPNIIPSAVSLSNRFYVSRDMMALPPMSKDFRIQMNQEGMDEFEEELKASWKKMTSTALNEVWSRLAELISKIADTMGQRDKKFHNSIIGNLKNFCDEIPSFNITDDKELEELRKDVMNKLACLDPEDLKEIPNKRKQASKDAKELLKTIDDYFK